MNCYYTFSKKIAFSLLVAMMFLPGMTDGQIITTFAGTGDPGNSGDGGFSTRAMLGYAGGMKFDGKGNLYFTDKTYHRIRKIDRYGVITTIAGTGFTGAMTGDKGPATNARMNVPVGMAFDKHGNLYFADNLNNRIRKIDTAGIITTVAGSGVAGFSGDDSAAVDAKIKQPTGVCFDNAGNMYIADCFNHKIRKVDTMGIIHTIAGRDTSERSYYGDGVPATDAILFSPNTIEALPDGSVIFTDAGNHVIRKIGTDGIITTIAGGGGKPGFGGDGGLASKCRFSIPSYMTVDKKGNIFVADLGNNRVRKIDGATGVINTVAGTGGPTNVVNNGDGGMALDATIERPSCVAIDSSENLYIGDKDNRIRYVFLGVPFNEEKVTIFPSLCYGTTTIILPSQYEEIANVYIFNMEGRRISESFLPTNKIVRLDFAVPGNYIIYAVSKRGTWKGRLTSLP